MDKPPNKKSLKKITTSEILTSILPANNYNKGNKEDSITFFEIKQALHKNSFEVFLMLFSLPLIIPVPAPPGYSTVFSLPLILFSIQFLCGHKTPWIPRFIGKRSIKRKTLRYILEKTIPFLHKVELFSKERFSIFNNPIGEKIYGIITLSSAILIAVPLPFTHSIPALGIVVLSFGILNRDGLISLLGVLIGLIGLFITILVLLLSEELITKLFSFFSSFFN